MAWPPWPRTAKTSAIGIRLSPNAGLANQIVLKRFSLPQWTLGHTGWRRVGIASVVKVP